ncbi:Pet112 protein [Candida orthopsilosis Co 90-125]|uniref:Glutamyl-tRNA(Gln) amidotransferase subunit B, mitochondrial n=1 Tax=Candida orthopsilosis (strain 90-125) TaxID=1136231 RepID=H8X049_CANO9|nr:Pet112 protein [Candida orthopsilosis Co 90-125]CCG22561.1 Pet112 protein [Candida orthopsilosis Co 90-125]
MLRRLTTSATESFRLYPEYKFKCGVEIHTQLKTKYKLFSLSQTGFNDNCNTKVSYFDLGLPGTQPKLNPEALYLALKASVALNMKIQPFSKFDRKHYFYPDQPLGYQITQHFHPLANDGVLELNEFDNASGQIEIETVQLEQDTGKKFGDIIDFNRAGTPLIEVVTKPDFQDINQVYAFIKKYQLLVRHLGICSGDLETGAIRVDVNLSVNDNPRVELKNLGTTGDIVNALKYEYMEQVRRLRTGESIIQETKSWDGYTTKASRSKENAVDYRYVPDSELPSIYLSVDIGDEIKASMPEYPDQLLSRLTSEPYNLQLAHAKNLLAEPEHLHYYQTFFEKFNLPGANKWMFQELITAFSKLDKDFDVNVISPDALVEIAKSDYSLVSKRLILRNIVENQVPLEKAIADLNLASDAQTINVNELCSEIVKLNPDVVKRIQDGYKNAIQVLVGKAMKVTKGKVHAKVIKDTFDKLL